VVVERIVWLNESAVNAAANSSSAIIRNIHKRLNNGTLFFSTAKYSTNRFSRSPAAKESCKRQTSLKNIQRNRKCVPTVPRSLILVFPWHPPRLGVELFELNVFLDFAASSCAK
jgi:hypothetical protein